MKEIVRRKWKWIDHVLRKDTDDITREAIFWTADGNRKWERPKITWRRTAEKEIKMFVHTWKSIETMAKDRVGWRRFVDALCAQ